MVGWGREETKRIKIERNKETDHRQRWGYHKARVYAGHTNRTTTLRWQCSRPLFVKKSYLDPTNTS